MKNVSPFFINRGIKPLIPYTPATASAAGLGAASGVGAGVSASPVVLTYHGFGSSGNQSFNPVTACPFGTAYANRRVLICIVAYNSYDGPISNVQIGSVTATLNYGTGAISPPVMFSSFQGQIAWAWADLPTGTTADVTITGGITSGNGSLLVHCYSFDKTLIANSTPTVGRAILATAGNSHTCTVNTGAGGFIIAANVGDLLAFLISGNNTATNLNISSSTESYTTDYNGYSPSAVDGFHMASKVSGSAANTPSSVTWSWTAGPCGNYGSVLAWN